MTVDFVPETAIIQKHGVIHSAKHAIKTNLILVWTATNEGFEYTNLVEYQCYFKAEWNTDFKTILRVNWFIFPYLSHVLWYFRTVWRKDMTAHSVRFGRMSDEGVFLLEDECEIYYSITRNNATILGFANLRRNPSTSNFS